ncbi:MAG: GDSL-type esterase/lipase family protein [Egibacteraceae bacterium]
MAWDGSGVRVVGCWERRATLVTVVGLGVGAQAVQAQAIGPDAFGYTADEVDFTFEDISQTGTRFLDSDDDETQELTLPFGFDFYGTTYNSVFASTNGLLTFRGGSNENVNQSLTGPLFADLPTAAVLWDDWITTNDGDALYFATLGSGSERRFVVQWNMVRSFGNQVGLITFQAVLFEGSNDIEYRYLDKTVEEDESVSQGGSATVGIRDTSGHENGENLQWSRNEDVIEDESALRFTTVPQEPEASYADLVLADEPQGYWRMGVPQGWAELSAHGDERGQRQPDVAQKAGVSTVARSATGVPADEAYHHVVATKDGPNSAVIYIDGVVECLPGPGDARHDQPVVVHGRQHHPTRSRRVRALRPGAERRGGLGAPRGRRGGRDGAADRVSRPRLRCVTMPRVRHGGGVSPGRRRLAIAAGVVACLGLAPAAGAQTSDSMVALGDSITIGLRSGPSCEPPAGCPENSWSTGATPAVNSHFLRLRASNPALQRRNFAVSARKVADLDRQAGQAVAQRADYVTILMGTNDVCRESLSAMTPVATFRSQLEAAMNRLTTGLPGARILVGSIPDWERLRQILKDNAAARAAWAADGTCAVFLQDPLAEGAALDSRRAAARQRLIELNGVLADVCARHPSCVHDGGALFDWRFEARHISTLDYFHPSVEGEAGLAELTFPAAFPPPPPPPPPPADDPPSSPPPPPPADDPPSSPPPGSGSPPGSGPGTPASPVSPGAQPPGGLPDLKFPAKLEVERARVLRADRRLDVLAPITARADGTVDVVFHAAGRFTGFEADVDAERRRVRFSHGIPAEQARLGTGIVTLRYPGNARTRPQEMRLRAASQPARLDLERPTLVDGRLRASGTITARARGVVRLQLDFTSGGEDRSLEVRGNIRDGRWSIDETLSEDDARAIASRQGTVHSYTAFTGYFPQRVRGEMRSFEVLP